MALNFLDLRPKVEPQIKIVERIVVKGRVWYVESVKIVAIIVIASGVVWGLSRADSVIAPQSTIKAKPWSTIGTITDIENTSISVDNTSYGLNSSSTLLKIETKTYGILAITDLALGDRVILQGQIIDGENLVNRIIDFTATSTSFDLSVVSSTDATSTDISDASSTLDASSSTPDVDTSDASTTDDTASSTPIVIVPPASTSSDPLSITSSSSSPLLPDVTPQADDTTPAVITPDASSSSDDSTPTTSTVTSGDSTPAPPSTSDTGTSTSD